MRKLRSSLAAATCAAALAAAAARAEEVDLAPLRARLAEAADDASTPPRSRARYVALRARLDRADVPGVADEFAKLERVARDVRGRLAADAVLAARLRESLAEALEALDDEPSRLAVGALDVVAAADQRKLSARVRRAQSFAVRARTAQVLGRADRACSSGRHAATQYAGAAALLARILRDQEARPPAWHTVLDGLDAALLSVHVADVPAAPLFVAGAADADGPTFLRGGPEGFVRVPIAAAGDLWWVDSVPGAGVWACGSGGTVAAYDPATGAVALRPVAEQTGTLYGVWGAAADDVWAVGDDPDADGPLSAAFRWDGLAWTSFPLPEAAAGRTLYKVWGRAADDVLACGRGGLLLRFDGSAWSEVASGTASSLLTVHGDAPAVAVGIAPVILERGGGGAWGPVALPPATESLNGVRAGADGSAWAVGYFRTVLRRTPTGWTRVAGVPATQGRDFHAVATDAAGGVWIAGGVLTTLRDGVLLHHGTRPYAGTIAPQAPYAARVRNVLYDSCAETACHAPPFLSEGLDLATAGGLRDRLAGVPSRQSPFPRVAPGRPSASYLFRKVEGTHAAAGGSGDRMPVGEILSAEDVGALRAWILEGAPAE